MAPYCSSKSLESARSQIYLKTHKLHPRHVVDLVHLRKMEWALCSAATVKILALKGCQ